MADFLYRYPCLRGIVRPDPKSSVVLDPFLLESSLFLFFPPPVKLGKMCDLLLCLRITEGVDVGVTSLSLVVDDGSGVTDGGRSDLLFLLKEEEEAVFTAAGALNIKDPPVIPAGTSGDVLRASVIIVVGVCCPEGGDFC